MANPATLEAIGKSEAEIIGKTDAEFHLNREEGEQMMENDRWVMQTGQVQVFEEVLEVAAGRRTFLSTKSPYRDPQGNIIGLIGVAFDVTDRKRAEAALQESEVRFRQMAETIDDVFWLFDPQPQQMLDISPD